jgi:hypothetical protein
LFYQLTKLELIAAPGWNLPFLVWLLRFPSFFKLRPIDDFAACLSNYHDRLPGCVCYFDMPRFDHAWFYPMSLAFGQVGQVFRELRLNLVKGGHVAGGLCDA